MFAAYAKETKVWPRRAGWTAEGTDFASAAATTVRPSCGAGGPESVCYCRNDCYVSDAVASDWWL